MSSSFVSFRGKGYWSGDAPLELWLRLIADKAKQVPAAPAWLQEAAEHWFVHSSVGFVGCVDAGLDTIVTDEERRQTVVALCASVVEDLQQGDLVLSVENFDALQTGGGSVYTRDVSASEFVKQGAVFLALLQGLITTTSKTAVEAFPSEAILAEALAMSCDATMP